MKEYIVSESWADAYRTLPEALAAVKADEHKLEKDEAIRIVIQGTQHLASALRITAEQLPGAEHPVFMEGADSSSGFSGGLPITGFSHWKENIWRVKVQQIEYTRHLYIDGKSAKRPIASVCLQQGDETARKAYEFANLPDEEEKKTVISNRPGEELEVEEWSGIATTQTEIVGWRNLRDVEMVFDVGWVHRVIPIEWVRHLPDGRLYIRPLEPAFRSSRLMDGVQIKGHPSYMENVFERLGTPFEWYFDRTEQMLYVCFADGDTPENHEIIIPRLEQLMEIKGELDGQPCHLCFRNLRFSHTTWLHPQKYGVPEVQANLMKYTEIPEELVREKPYEADYQKVIAALRVLSARDVSFECCVFTALGTGALQYEFGTQGCRIIGNHFYEIGGSAVTLGDFYPERAHHPEDKREIVRGIEVTNNYIHDTGCDSKGSVAIIAGYVQDVTIAHNEIHDVPYSAINVGWGWGQADVSVGPKLLTPYQEPSVCMRNRVMYNHIHRCMMKLHDGGAIYTLGAMSGSVVSGNYIHGSSGFEGDGYERLMISGYQSEAFESPTASEFWSRLKGVPGGIYLDEGSAGIEVCDNLLHDVAIPLYYHNQIDFGYTMVWFRDNILNQRPGDKEFSVEIAGCAGLEPAYRYLTSEEG